MITNNNSYLNDLTVNTGTGTTISDILDTVVAVSNINGKSTKISKQKQYKFPGAVVDSKGNNIYIKEVIYSNPATIVLWSDKTKTICKAVEADTYNPEAGLAICILKKVLGNTAVRDLFESWCCFDSFEQPVRVNLAQAIKEFKK